MNKLTAEVARRHQRDLKSYQENPKIGLSLKEELYLQALEIALPILEQQELDNTWIEWGGGRRPVERTTMIGVRFRNKEEQRSPPIHFYEWRHFNVGSDIIAYRVIPDQTTNQNGEQSYERMD